MSRTIRAANTGSTLVELLVVVAVIAVLAAMLYPVLHAAREKARQSVCASNLHQLQLAVDMYVEDNDDGFPISYVASRLGPYQSWREAVQPYVRDRRLLVCPSSDTGEKQAELSPERQGSYALNAWLSPPDLTDLGGSRGEPVALGAVSDPSATILLCDAGYSNAPVALDYDHYAALGMQEQPLPSERHQGGANFAFIDGHVKRMPESATRSPDYLWDLQ